MEFCLGRNTKQAIAMIVVPKTNAVAARCSRTKGMAATPAAAAAITHAVIFLGTGSAGSFSLIGSSASSIASVRATQKSRVLVASSNRNQVRGANICLSTGELVAKIAMREGAKK